MHAFYRHSKVEEKDNAIQNVITIYQAIERPNK